MKSTGILIFFIMLSACANTDTGSDRIIKATNIPMIIDGQASEEAWQTAEWQDIDQLWIGSLDNESDFKGRFKLLWDAQHLYVLAEIQDDTLIDIHPHPLERYWDDDCLEIFVDEDNSGGIHQYNHSAFAYHIALDGRVVDMGTDSLPHYYDNHLTAARHSTGTLSTWEVAVRLYDRNYEDGRESSPVALSQSKKVGFAIAYCDNDRSAERESFIGSEFVEGEDKNRGWIDAGIFGSYILE